MKRDPLPVYLAAAMIFIGFIICFAGTWVRSVHAGKLEAQMLEGLSLGPCFLAVGFFSICMRLEKKGYGKLECIAKALSGGAFCVYLVHLLVLRALTHIGLSTGAASVLPFRFRSLCCCVSQAATASICF